MPHHIALVEVFRIFFHISAARNFNVYFTKVYHKVGMATLPRMLPWAIILSEIECLSNLRALCARKNL